jgi:fructuronate reductase
LSRPRRRSACRWKRGLSVTLREAEPWRLTTADEENRGDPPMRRLARNTLADLPRDVARPQYDLDDVRTGVVHLGVGAFHRAHQAVVFDGRLAAGERDWAICGVSLQSPATRDALAPQDALYTVSIRGREREDLEVIGALRDLLVAPEDPQAPLARLADPRVRIVTLTITEKGYCHDPASGDLAPSHPAIMRDLAAPHAPLSAPGVLVEALRRRRDAGEEPFAVLSCDNLPANGATLRRAATQFAALRDPDLARWIDDRVSFPSTMVDRIVPATTDDVRAQTAKRLGVEDAWPVVTEPFWQWVIEDRFPAGRPRLEESGATMVADVVPFELAKLRLLNGTHSALAYLGYLAGFETLAETVAAPSFARFARGLMDEEVTPTLAAHGAQDLTSYKRMLFERFQNPSLRHRTWQIAMDGSQKLPQRTLPVIRERLEAGASIRRLALVVAAWMRYVAGLDERGRAIDVRDPLAVTLESIADRSRGDAVKLGRDLLGLRQIFPADLASDPRLRERIDLALTTLFQRGAKATIDRFEQLFPLDP